MKLFRKIYNLSIIIIIILGLIKLFQRDFYLAFIWIILVPILLLLPRNLYKINKIKLNYNHKIVDFFEILFFILLITSASFTLGLKNINIDFDSFTHFLNLIIYTLIFGIIYYILRTKDYKEPNKNEVVLFSFLFTLTFGVILWEKFQLYNDNLFNTQMFYDKFQNVEFDSFLDQVFGSIGVITGVIILYNKIELWFKKWKK